MHPTRVHELVGQQLPYVTMSKAVFAQSQIGEKPALFGEKVLGDVLGEPRDHIERYQDYRPRPAQTKVRQPPMLSELRLAHVIAIFKHCTIIIVLSVVSNDVCPPAASNFSG